MQVDANHSEDEVIERYQLVAERLSPAQFQAAAEAAYTQFTSNERASAARLLRQAARITSIQTDVTEEPRSLAMITKRIQYDSPGGLPGLLQRFRGASSTARERERDSPGGLATGLGVGVGVGLGGGLAGGLLGAAAGRAIQRGDRGGDWGGSTDADHPVVNMALAAIAAEGMRRTSE